MEAVEKESKDEHSYNPPIYSNSNNTLLIISGVFSIIFSMSTLSQLYSESSIIANIVLGVFLLTILIFNERYKVQSIISIGKDYKQGKIKITSIIVALITVLISLSSVYGLYTGVDKIVNYNNIKQEQSRINSDNTVYIDSLNNLLLYKIDSLALASNPIVKKNIEDLENVLKKTYRASQIEQLNDQISKEKEKINSSKQSIEKHIKDKLLQANKVDKAIVDSTSSTNFDYIKIGLSLLALITEMVIISLSFFYGYNKIEFEKMLEDYNIRFNEAIRAKRKELLSKPQIKKMLEYITLLELLGDLRTSELVKKDIEDVSELMGRRYSVKEVNDFRNTMIQLEIFETTSNNKVRLSQSIDEARVTLDTFFSKLVKS